jgi:hypothetical protein
LPEDNKAYHSSFRARGYMGDKALKEDFILSPWCAYSELPPSDEKARGNEAPERRELMALGRREGL